MCGHGIIAVVTIAIERGLIQRDGAPWRRRVADRRSTRRPARFARAATIVDQRDGRRPRRARVVRQRAVVRASRRPAGEDRRAHCSRGRRVRRRVLRDRRCRGRGPPDRRRAADRSARRRHGDQARRRGASDASCIRPNPASPGSTGRSSRRPPTRAGADLRNVTIFAEREVDRSPCGTGTCAVLAVLDAMGLVDPSRPFVHESIIGTTFSARVVGRTTVGELPAIVPELTGERVDHRRAHVHRATATIRWRAGFACRKGVRPFFTVFGGRCQSWWGIRPTTSGTSNAKTVEKGSDPFRSSRRTRAASRSGRDSILPRG